MKIITILVILCALVTLPALADDTDITPTEVNTEEIEPVATDTEPIPALISTDKSQGCGNSGERLIDWLITKYHFYHWRAEHKRVAMETTISFFGEKGYDSTELTEIKDNFLALYDNAEAAANDGDREGFNDIVEQGKNYIKKFRETVNEILSGLETSELRLDIKTALEENKDYLDELQKKAIDSRNNHYIKAFDNRICVHQKMIDRIENNGYDANELQDELDAINAKRDELESKVDDTSDSCFPKLIWNCKTDEADALKEYVEEIHKDFKTFRENLREFIKNQIKTKVEERRANKEAEKEKKAETIRERKEKAKSSDDDSEDADDETGISDDGTETEDEDSALSTASDSTEGSDGTGTLEVE